MFAFQPLIITLQQIKQVSKWTALLTLISLRLRAKPHSGKCDGSRNGRGIEHTLGEQLLGATICQ